MVHWKMRAGKSGAGMTQEQPGEAGLAPTAIAAVTAAVVYGLGIYGLTVLLLPDSGMAVLGFLLGGPVACCALASFILGRRRNLAIGSHAMLALIVVTAMMVAASIVLREGAICLAMAAPFFYGPGIVASIVVGALMRKPSRGSTAACWTAICLPLLALPAETTAVYPEKTGSVTSSVVIDAPPAVVWANTAELRDIQPKELSADFSHTVLGVPQPLDAKLEGTGEGAVRRIRWAKDVHFEEVVTDWEPARRLAWRFNFASDSVPLALERRINLNGDYLRLRGGEYRFTALPDGRTRLTLRTDYWVRTPINAYCDIWGLIFLNDMHGAVLDVVKARSEAGRA